MKLYEACNVLEIERTKDRKKIEKAYRKICRKYRIKKDSALFFKICKAYQNALRYSGDDTIPDTFIPDTEDISAKLDRRIQIIWDICFFLSGSRNFCNEALKKIGGKDIYTFEFFYLNEKRDLEEWKKIIRKIADDFSSEDREIIKAGLEIVFGEGLLHLDISPYEKDFLMYYLLDSEKIGEIRDMFSYIGDTDNIIENFSKRYIRIESKKNLISFKLYGRQLEEWDRRLAIIKFFSYKEVKKNIEGFARLMDTLNIENDEGKKPGILGRIALSTGNMLKIVLLLINLYSVILGSEYDLIVLLITVILFAVLIIVNMVAAARDRTLFGGLDTFYYDCFIIILLICSRIVLPKDYSPLYYFIMVILLAIIFAPIMFYVEHFITRKKYMRLKNYILSLLSIYEY